MQQIVPMKITQIPNCNPTDRESRISSHSHIKGLGLNDDGVPNKEAYGFVGQVEAREACGFILDLIRMRKMSGRAVLLAGPSGSGKTAIALAISQELGTKVPFYPMVASDVYSQEVKKTEILMEAFRRSIGLRVKEVKEVYEGEITELKIQETENPFSSSGSGAFGKAIGSVIVGLKSAKGTKQLKLDPSIYENLQKERASVGDVIYIEAGSGAVNRLGRSDSFAAEYDLEADTYVPLPKGEVYKKREVVTDVTLHDLDCANARPQGGNDMLSLVNNLLRPKKTEITDKLRSEINKIVNKYVEQGTAELIPGVLFIDEAHLLDVECFSFFIKALESEIAPIVVLATNRGMHQVRNGNGQVSPHGIPTDFLDRLLIVKTAVYNREEARAILKIRSEVEKIPSIEPEAMEFLSELATTTSLRYSLQLMYPASIIAGSKAHTSISRDDVKEASLLFLDAKSVLSCDTAAPMQQ